MAEPGIQIKQGTTTPPVHFRLKRGRKPLQILGADVYLRFKSIDGTGSIYGGLCENLDDGNESNRGRCLYDPGLSVAAPVGYYYAEIKVIWAPGTPGEETTFIPSHGRGFEIVEIIASYG